MSLQFSLHANVCFIILGGVGNCLVLSYNRHDVFNMEDHNLTLSGVDCNDVQNSKVLCERKTGTLKVYTISTL